MECREVLRQEGTRGGSPRANHGSRTALLGRAARPAWSNWQLHCRLAPIRSSASDRSRPPHRPRRPRGSVRRNAPRRLLRPTGTGRRAPRGPRANATRRAPTRLRRRGPPVSRTCAGRSVESARSTILVSGSSRRGHPLRATLDLLRDPVPAIRERLTADRPRRSHAGLVSPREHQGVARGRSGRPRRPRGLAASLALSAAHIKTARPPGRIAPPSRITVTWMHP